MAKTYDLKSVICTIGGVAISGYGENDAIGIEQDEPINTTTVTADGDNIFSRNNNRAITITLTLSQKSRAHLLLFGLMQAQTGDLLPVAPPQIPPLPFYLLDLATGETIVSADTVFMTRPSPSKNKTVGDVQYELKLPRPVHTPPVANLI